MSEDVSVERLSVAEAAHVLSVTRDAIHKRISWGSIEHERGEDGRLCVYVDTSTLGLESSVANARVLVGDVLETSRMTLQDVRGGE